MVGPMPFRSSPLKVVALAVAMLAGTGVGVWWLQIHDFNLRVSIDAGIVVLRDAGPWAFFTAFALLPAVGFPIMVFYLTAGTAFAERMGLPGVLAAAGGAILVNISLTYWLARYALRPWLEQMISRTKYKIPVVPAAERLEIALLLRITPGPPFFVQSYLLGLAEIPFGTYLLVSWPVAMSLASGLIVFGDALLHGKGRAAFLGISAITAVTLLIHLARRHYGKKRS